MFVLGFVEDLQSDVRLEQLEEWCEEVTFLYKVDQRRGYIGQCDMFNAMKILGFNKDTYCKNVTLLDRFCQKQM